MFINEKLPVYQNTVLPPRRIIALSPIAQVFNQNVDIEHFLENPHSVLEKPESLGGKGPEIEVVVPLSSKTWKFTLGKVYTVTADEALVLVGTENGQQWSNIANGSGLVYFDLPEKLLLAYQYASENNQKIPKELKAEVDKYTNDAAMWSEKRIIDFIKKLYNDMLAGRSTLEQNGGKAPPPNDYEMLYTFLIRETIRQGKDRRKALRDAFAEATAEIEGEGLSV